MIDDLRTKYVYGFAVLLFFGLLIQASVPVGAQGEPEFRVEFRFGTVGINGIVVDGSTGRRIDKDKVTFVALPGSVTSLDGVKRIRVTASGYRPTYVRRFSRVTARFLFFNFTVIDIGRVVLRPAQPRNQAPQARFNYSPGNPRPGEMVNFDASRSYDPDGYVTNYNWDFDGDGRTDASGKYASFRFRSPGNSNVTLRVWDNDGASSSATQTIHLSSGNQAPVARFSYSPEVPRNGEMVRFNALDSYDPDGSIRSYRWDFDEDGFTDAYGRRVSHSFRSSGSYEVVLTVVDDDGSKSSTRKIVRVQGVNQQPHARFTYNPDRPGPGEDVRFDGSDSFDPDGDILSHRWDFDGDGDMDSFGIRTSHSFDSPGSYEVTLTVIDDKGARVSTTRTVRVFRSQLVGFASSEPDSFQSNGERTGPGDGYWLRNWNHYAKWDWNGTSQRPQKAFINFHFLVTNGYERGSGYDASVEVKILNRFGNTIESGSVILNNPFRPDFSGDTGGVGYDAYGAYQVQNSAMLRNGFTVRVEWPPQGNRNHFAVKRSAALLAYTT